MKKIVLIILGVVVLAGAAYGLRNIGNKTTSSNNYSNSINNSPGTKADNSPNNSRKSSPPSSGAQTLIGQPTYSKGSTTTTQSSASVIVTRVNVGSSTLQVGTVVSGITSGTCQLTATQSGQSPVTASSNVTQQNNGYMCSVFNVPLSNFPNKGNWNISVSVTGDGLNTSNQWSNNPVNLSGSN